MFRGLVGTKAVEDTFGLFADEARQHKAGRLGRLARWHRASTAPLIEDFDRKQVQIDNKARASAQRFSAKSLDSLFLPKECTFSLGQEVLNEFMSASELS